MAATVVAVRRAWAITAHAPRGTAVWSSILSTCVLGSAVLAAQVSGFSVPTASAGDLEPMRPGQSSTIVDRHGRVLARLDEGFDRRVVGYGHLPAALRDAVVAIEDDAYWRHGGVDLGALARAFLSNLAEGRVEQGGSTITMQYARNALERVGRERTTARKFREIAAAMQLEDHMSKRQILAGYLNLVYFGRGAYGADAGARAWFGKPVRRLGVAGAATLAGLIHAPSAYAGEPQALRARRNLVLERMARIGAITQARARQLARRPLAITRYRRAQVRAPYFVEYVKHLVRAPVSSGGFGVDQQELLRGGLTIHTTLDLSMQRAAERAVAAVANRRGDPETALVAMSTTGKVRAMVGGRRQHLARARGFNFAVQRTAAGGRQAGSTFKPFALATYIEQGRPLGRTYPAPGTLSVDGCGANGGSWRVSNYDDRSYGSLDVPSATELSVNTVYAQLAAEVGPGAVASMAARLGIDGPVDPVCSVALGTAGVTPLEMATAYGTFAARGVRHDRLAVVRIERPDGSTLARGVSGATIELEREDADRVNAVLQGVVERGTGAPAALDRPAAGKTGTTEGLRDLWFVGYTPHPGLVASVWVGHRERGGRPPAAVQAVPGRPATGGGFAGAIWKRFMTEATRSTPERDFVEVALDLSDTADGIVVTREAPDTVIVRGPKDGRGPEKDDRKRGKAWGRKDD